MRRSCEKCKPFVHLYIYYIENDITRVPQKSMALSRICSIQVAMINAARGDSHVLLQEQRLQQSANAECTVGK